MNGIKLQQRIAINASRREFGGMKPPLGPAG